MESIARALGVSRMTVSRALRGSASVAEGLREAVLEEAKRQGYKPNPLISAWMKQVRQGEEAASKPAIAYVSPLPRTGPHSTSANSYLREMRRGARQRARELGFKLWEFHDAGSEIAWEEVAERMTAAGVAGVILAPGNFLVRDIRVELPWEHFCFAAIGFSMSRPAMHTINDEQHSGTTAILRRLQAAGCRRIGCMSSPHHEEHHSHGRIAAFLAWQQETPDAGRIPLLRVADLPKDLARFHGRIREWCARHRPEVIVGTPSLRQHLHDALKGLGSETRLPDFCGLGINPQEPLYQTQYGITEPCFEIGLGALEMIAGLVYRHETGLPEHPVLIEVPGAHWNWKKYGPKGARQ
jgi:DNA-binding transcriptional ArsR family regulator